MANSPARVSLDVGAVIAGTYTIEALLGRGGMGSVFLASHARLPGKRVAIKLLHVELTDDDVIARFRREALIASQLDHPNIVRVDDYNVTDDGTPYLVLEYLEGESLAKRLEAGALSVDQTMSILRQVGSAVAAAHRAGIIHRDLKPQNIFLIPTERDGHVVEVAKVLDFGISKMRGRDTVKTQESTLLGTPQYMAPEQATGNHAAVDERTDIFALGAIAYEMLTGTPAFSGQNIPEVVFKVVYEQPLPLPADLPAEVVAAITTAMAKQQDERFPDVGAFVEALTGRPLVQRQSMVSMPPRDAAPRTTTTGKRAGQAAYANTIDSGSVAKDAVSPHAQTVASQPGEVPAPVVAKPRSRGLVIGLAVAALLALGAIGYVVTRSAPKATVPDAAVATVEIDAAPAVSGDAAIEVDAAVIADAAVATIDAGVKKPAGGGTVAKPKGDPLAAEDLRKAHAAYKAESYEQAKLHCNAVIGSAVASTAQIDEALVLRGTIHCKHLHSVGLAQADARAITSPALRGTLRARCGL